MSKNTKKLKIVWTIIKVKGILVLFDRLDFSFQRPTINDSVAMRVEYSHFLIGVKTYTRLLLSSRPPPQTIQNAFSIIRAIHYDYNVAARPRLPPSTYGFLAIFQAAQRIVLHVSQISRRLLYGR